jgi:2-polyprenyl-3-methyl-5-hydroxy-6-metoxy-1,4-benzoquinol methylase
VIQTRTKRAWNEVSEMNLAFPFILGPINGESLLKDPKHLAFTLTRYKFAAKMMAGCKHILEVGCGEGLGVLMFLAETSARITAIDFDERQIEYIHEQVLPRDRGNRLTLICQDFIVNPHTGPLVDGLACLDMIEHVDPSEEDQLFTHCADCLEPYGIGIFGTPNKMASLYASPRSRQGHINLFDPERLVSTLERRFRRVFLFSMNDELVHTGYNKMAHYLMALAVK